MELLGLIVVLFLVFEKLPYCFPQELHQLTFPLTVYVQFNSVQSLSHVRLFATHGLQHARPPCPSPTPGVYSNSCPLSRWCHPTISSSVIPFSSHPQSFPASEAFQMSQLFTSGGQSIYHQYIKLNENYQTHDIHDPICGIFNIKFKSYLIPLRYYILSWPKITFITSYRKTQIFSPI